MSSLAFTILNSGSGGWGRGVSGLLGGINLFLKLHLEGSWNFIFSLKEGQEVLFSLMANLASPPPGINIECSLINCTSLSASLISLIGNICVSSLLDAILEKSSMILCKTRLLAKACFNF